MLFGIGEKRYLEYSIALHVGVILVFVLGLPTLLERAEPQPLVMTVEIIPIGPMTNIKPSDKPIQKQKVAKLPVNKKPTPKTAPEKPKEPEPEPEPVKKEAVPIPEEKPKEQEKKKEKPKEEKPKPKPADDFAALMNKLKTEESKTEDKEAKDTENAEENTTRSDAPYDETLPLSITEKDAIRSQFIRCWHMPAGAKNANELVVKVNIHLQADGTVMKAEIARDQMGRYSSDTYFRAAAESALRAVHKCSPLQNLPADKYGSWREMELTFDPQELLY